MYCKHCGKEISETAKFCDGCGKPVAEEVEQAPSTVVKGHKKKSKKKHPILATFLILFGFFIIIGSIGGSDEPKKVDAGGAPAANVATVTETTVPSVFTVGDTLEMGNVLVTLNDVSESNGSQFLKPAEGNIFVVCEFTIENNSDSEMAVSSMMSFECYFDDYATTLSLGALTADQSKKQLDGSVAPGKKISGVVGYEAPVDWEEMEVHFKTSMYASKPFVFNYSK